MALLAIVPEVLEMSSVLHVTLLVFLRLLAIMKPISYKQIHTKLRYNSIIVIWLTSMFFHSATKTALLFENKTLFDYGNWFILLSFNILPVVLIIIMYIVLMWILRDKTSKNNPGPNNVELNSNLNSQLLNNQPTIATGAEQMERKMTLAIQRIVLFVIFCYGPFLIWRVYYYAVVNKRDDGKVGDREVILILRFLISIRLKHLIHFVHKPIIYIKFYF